MELVTLNFEIYEFSENVLSLIVYNNFMANAINRRLKYYSTNISRGEEPLFLISRDKINEIYDLLPKANQNTFVKEKLKELSVKSN